MVLSEWNRSARSWAVNKLRAANKRASLHHRWTVAALLERWKMGVGAKHGSQREMYGQTETSKRKRKRFQLSNLYECMKVASLQFAGNRELCCKRSIIWLLQLRRTRGEAHRSELIKIWSSVIDWLTHLDQLRFPSPPIELWNRAFVSNRAIPLEWHRSVNDFSITRH